MTLLFYVFISTILTNICYHACHIATANSTIFAWQKHTLLIFLFLELVQADRAILRKLHELYSERDCWDALQYAFRIPLHNCRFLPGHPPNIGLQVGESWSCSACFEGSI